MGQSQGADPGMAKNGFSNLRIFFFCIGTANDGRVQFPEAVVETSWKERTLIITLSSCTWFHLLPILKPFRYEGAWETQQFRVLCLSLGFLVTTSLKLGRI